MHRRTAALAACALAALVSGPASADEDIDDILGGFEDELEVEPAEPPEQEGEAEAEAEAEDDAREEAEEPALQLPDWLDLRGVLSFDTSYGYLPHETAAEPHRASWGGLNRLRLTLELEADVELPAGWQARIGAFGFWDPIFAIRGRGNYTDEVFDTYETELDLLEVWVRGSPHERVDLKLGRQILNWGRSDTLRVIDVINPLDNRDPGLVDIENLRRPVTMARVDTFFGDWSLTGLVIPEIRFDKLPPYGSDFVASPVPLPPKDAPDHWGDDPEFGGALSGVFSGWDVSFHALRYWTNVPRLEVRPPTGPTQPPVARFVYDRRTLVGGGSNVTYGNWLAKGELAWIDGVKFTDAEETDRVDAMLGVEYYGFDDTSIALEIVNRHLTNFDSAAKRAPDFQRENSMETALRVNVDLLNARLHLVGVGVVFGERFQDGGFVRLQATFDLRDALALTGGILVFASGDRRPIDDWGQNDRLFAELRWSF